MSLTSAEPLLYSVEDDGTPVLTGTRDSSGFISFPFQTVGSLLNGEYGSALESIPLSGRGHVQAAATVHRTATPEVEVPYTVAAIVLEEGPMVRGVISAAGSIAVGTPVAATTTRISRDTGDVYELRFEVMP